MTKPCRQLFEMEAEPGVPLRGEIFLPSGRGARPPILLRSLYAPVELEWLASRLAALGHPVLVQSVRGRGASGGVFAPYRHEGEDGLRTLEWLQSRRGARPAILLGAGYDGQAALALACRAPAGALAGVALGDVPAVAPERWGWCTNGVLNGATLAEAAAWLNLPATPALLATFQRWLPGLSPFAAAPHVESWVLRLRNACRDGAVPEFARTLFGDISWRLPDAPTLLLGHWDAPSLGGMRLLAENGAAAITAPLEFAISDHAPDGAAAYAEALPALQGWLARHWGGQAFAKKILFHHKTRNCNYLMHSFGNKPPRHAQADAPAAEGILHLHAGMLAPFPVAEDAATSELHASPGCAAPSGLDFAPGSPVDENGFPLAWRDDTLAFPLAPLALPLVLDGAPSLRLWTECNRPDALLVFRLVAVPPDAPESAGRVISRGAARLALPRCGPLCLHERKDDGPIALEIPLSPLAWRLPARSRLRLEISGGECPRFLPALADRRIPAPRAHFTFHHSQERPSCLRLPIRPSRAPP